VIGVPRQQQTAQDGNGDEDGFPRRERWGKSGGQIPGVGPISPVSVG